MPNDSGQYRLNPTISPSVPQLLPVVLMPVVHRPFHGWSLDSGCEMEDHEKWELVKAHDRVIRGIVGMAVALGRLDEQDRKDAVTKGQLLAFKLADRWKPKRGPFENYLARYLNRELLHEATHSGTDAQDHSTVEMTERIPNATPREDPYMPSEVEELIKDRIPARLQAIARMALIEHLTVTQIAHRTGRSQPGPKTELRKIITCCRNQVYGPQKSG